MKIMRTQKRLFKVASRAWEVAWEVTLKWNLIVGLGGTSHSLTLTCLSELDGSEMYEKTIQGEFRPLVWKSHNQRLG